MEMILKEHLGFSQANLELNEETSTDGKVKELHMSGIFIQGDVKNHNQRVYPKHEITSAVNDVMSRINSGFSVLGEADHPESLTVNLDRVSHMITKMWMVGSDGYGKLKVLPTPMGQIVKTLLESNVKLGVSSRGSGNLSHDGRVSEYEIITVDVVANPSAPEAYPRPIYESLMNMNGGAKLHNLAKNSVLDKKAEKYLTKDILRFIEELKKK